MSLPNYYRAPTEFRLEDNWYSVGSRAPDRDRDRSLYMDQEVC